MTKRIIFHVFMILIGFSGLFIGTLPDTFPEYMDILLFGDQKKMDIAYKKLVAYANVPRGIRESDVALAKEDIGHKVTYGLLRSFDPALPSLGNSNSKVGDITVDTGGFVNTNTELLMNQVIHIKDNKNDWLPICELRDLHFLIRDSHIRYFSKIGILFALLALVSEFIMNIKREIRR